MISPDRYRLSKHGIILYQLNKGTICYQHVTIKSIRLPDIPEIIPEQHLPNPIQTGINQVRSELESRKKNSIDMFVKFRKHLIHNSKDYVTEDVIYARQLSEIIQDLKKIGCEIHLTKLNEDSERTELNVTAIYYGIKRTEYDLRDPECWIRNNETELHLDIPTALNLYQTCKHRKLVQFSTDRIIPYKYCSQSISIPSYAFSKIVEEFHTDIVLSLADQIKSRKYIIGSSEGELIHIPHRLGLIAAPNGTNKIFELLHNQRLIKVGGLQPEGFVSVFDLDIKLDLLWVMEEFPSDYAPILSLIAELYNIRDFAEMFRIFYDSYKESKSEEQSDSISISYIYHMLKDVPLASFEIPIDQKTKVNLLLFFLRFSYLQILEGTCDLQQIPKRIHFPVHKGRERDMLLILVLFQTQSNLQGEKFDIVFIDNPKIQRLMHHDGIKPNLGPLSKRHIIYCDTFPGRTYLNSYHKLIVQPHSGWKTYLNDINEKVAINSARSFWLTPENNIYEISLSNGTKLQKVNLTVHSPEKQNIDQVEKSNQPVSPLHNQSSHNENRENIEKIKKQSVEELVDQLKKEAVSSTDHNESSKLENKVQLPDMEPDQSPTDDPNTVETINEFEALEIFESIFNIRSSIKSDNSWPKVETDAILELIETGTALYSILSRSYYSSTSKIVQEDLDELEKTELMSTVKHNFIQLEASGQFYITKFGKDRIQSTVKSIREYQVTEDQLQIIVNNSEEIMKAEEEYGALTFAHARLRNAQILGMQYYNKFKLIPPLVLAITKLYEKLTFFDIDDPKEFSTVFDAKFVTTLEEYRQDITEDNSRVREKYIDTKDQPVPQPFIEKKEDNEKFELNIRDTTLVPVYRRLSPVKLIETQNTQQLDETLPEPDPDAPPFITAKKYTGKTEEAKNLDLATYKPQPLTGDMLYEVINKFQEKYNKYYGNNIREVFNSEKREVMIFDNSITFNHEIIHEFPLEWLNINGRILNVATKQGISSIGEFITTQFVTDIPNIGIKSLTKIEQIQSLLVSDVSDTTYLYVFKHEAFPSLLKAGLEPDLDILPTDIFFPYKLLDRDLSGKLSDVNGILDITQQFLKTILGDIFGEEGDNLTDSLILLHNLQKKNYPLLLDYNAAEIQQTLRLDYVYRVHEQFEKADTSTRNKISEMYRQRLIEYSDQIHVNSTIFDHFAK